MLKRIVSLLAAMALCAAAVTYALAEGELYRVTDSDVLISVSGVTSITEMTEEEFRAELGYDLVKPDNPSGKTVFTGTTAYNCAAPVDITIAAGGLYLFFAAFDEEQTAPETVTLPVPAEDEDMGLIYQEDSRIKLAAPGKYLIVCSVSEDAEPDAFFVFVSEPQELDTITLPETAEAVPTASTVLLDGDAVVFDAYLIGGYNFFKLRDLAYMLSDTDSQFEVDWDSVSETVILTSGLPYTALGTEMSQGTGEPVEASRADLPVTLDGNAMSLAAYNIGGYNYVRLRDVGTALDFFVGYDEDAHTVIIDSSEVY